jgi:nucleotide-binding universal stress UspA family protein
MAHTSHRLSNSFQGALAGGGDPATSPLYVFGPFLKLIVAAGVAGVTFGASIWLVVFTVATVSLMYRLVMRWVVDGSGGSGLTEEEFGPWAVKVNAGITFVEYTLTFLVSVAALVTFLADRFPVLNHSVAGVPYRTPAAVLFSVGIGWLVNRGPKTAARAFGPATFGVLLLLWAMIVATVARDGIRLPPLDWRAFTPAYLNFTLGGFARILAVMTGIEVFANLVAAYEGTNEEKSRKAFGSLVIVMATTSLTMLVVGPAILELSDPADPRVSVFTQTMDALLPAPLPWLGTLIGVLVLGSAAAASAQGIQNLALGLRYRHYIPARLGARNRFEVADKPVWIEVAVVGLCFALLGTSEETFLAIYAAGVFILLSMTGWAAAKRLLRETRARFAAGSAATLAGTVVAASLTTAATVIIFGERFLEGAWTYLLFIPALYALFSRFRSRLGPPKPLDEHLGRFFTGQYLLPLQRRNIPEGAFAIRRILVPLEGTALDADALTIAEQLARKAGSRLALLEIRPRRGPRAEPGPERASAVNLEETAQKLRAGGLAVETAIRSGNAAEEIARHAEASDSDIIVMGSAESSQLDRLIGRSLAASVIRRTELPVLLIRPLGGRIGPRTSFRKILVCLDGSMGSEEILPWARNFARYFVSVIVFLTVPEADEEKEPLEEYIGSVAGAFRKLGFAAETRVTGTGASRTIASVAESEGCDLIMMATRGRGAPEGSDVKVGSVTDHLIQTARCPVFTAKVLGLAREAKPGFPSAAGTLPYVSALTESAGSKPKQKPAHTGRLEL